MKKKWILLIVISIGIGVLAASMPMRHKYTCSKNLREINEAKWAAIHAEHYPIGTMIPSAVLTKYIKGGKLPECPSGGRYIIPVGSESPVCSFHGNLLSKYSTAQEACINNLRIIDAGKEEYSADAGRINTVTEKK